MTFLIFLLTGETPGPCLQWLLPFADRFLCDWPLSTATDDKVDVDPAPIIGDVLNGFPLAVNMRPESTLVSSVLSESNIE